MTEQPPFPGLILAGGRARRMGGGDKGLLPLAGRPILAHVIGRLAPQAGPLALGANGAPERFAAFGLPVVDDGGWQGAGPLAGVLAGLRWARGLGADRIVTVAADMPFLPRDLVSRLAAAGSFAVASAPDGEDWRLHPTCGVWPLALAPALEAALGRGERRVGAWALAAGAAEARFPDARSFLNVNRPEDLAAAESAAVAYGVPDARVPHACEGDQAIELKQ